MPRFTIRCQPAEPRAARVIVEDGETWSQYDDITSVRVEVDVVQSCRRITLKRAAETVAVAEGEVTWVLDMPGVSGLVSLAAYDSRAVKIRPCGPYAEGL